MIRGLEIENFKAFGPRQVAPLAPLTLIYGPNSGGKSSLLQALLVLKQTGDGALAVRGESVDLGDFRAVVHGHDARRRVRIAAEPCAWTEDESPRVSWHGRLARSLGQEGRGEEVVAIWPTALPSLGQSVGSPPSSDAPLEFRGSHVAPLERWAVWLATEAVVWAERDPTAAIGEHVALLRWIARGSSAHTIHPVLVGLEHLQSATQQGLGEHAGGLCDLLVRSYLSILPSCTVSSGFWCSRPGDERTEWIEPPFLQRAAKRRDHLCQAVQRALDEISHIGPIRHTSARRTVRPQHCHVHDSVGQHGEQALDLLENAVHLDYWGEADVDQDGHGAEYLRERVHSALAALGLPYTVRLAEFVSSELGSIRVAYLDDHGLPLEMGDVGFGVGQVLPVVIEAVLGPRRIKVVEQPEIHLHPRQQAALADVFIESVQTGPDHTARQWLIETHSEALMLRIQRRIREGVLKAEDVSVLYVKPGEDGSRIHHLRIDDDGSFIDDWPDGFFEERFDDLFEV